MDHAAGEVMHPGVGPRIESESLYVLPSRLAARLADGGAHDALVLLDVGLGAGSNAVAAWHASEARGHAGRRLEIASFDHSLAALELATQPENAADFAFDPPALSAARGLLATGAHMTPQTTWQFHMGELPATLDALPPACADIVFWDPFSPRAEPALWTAGAFAALRRVCRAGATVHTYSGATAVRTALLLAGFCVGAGARTDNLRETTVAAVDLADLARPLDARWLERVGRSSAPFPVDAPADALARLAAHPQFAAT